jgi:hypothetical protein
MLARLHQLDRRSRLLEREDRVDEGLGEAAGGELETALDLVRRL